MAGRKLAKWIKGKWKTDQTKVLSKILLTSILFGLMSPLASRVAIVDAASLAPELYITELHPDVSGADDYEFLELYNASEQTLSLHDYTVLYRYTDGSKADAALSISDATLAPGQLLVVWNNNNKTAPKTLADFNAKYGIALDSSQVVEISGFDGFYNSGNRALVIQSSQGQEIASATYLKADIGSGLGVQYKPGTGSVEEDKLAVLSAPTPGTALAEQLHAPAEPLPGEAPAVNYPPVITHVPVTTANAAAGLVLDADILNPDTAVTGSVYSAETVTGAVYYQIGTATDYTILPMTKSLTGGTYTALIPAAALTHTQLQYFIEARDEGHAVRTDTYTVLISGQDEVDYNLFPTLLITELVPDTANYNSADAYEFVEIYNNSDQTVDFAEYELVYRNGSTDTVWTVLNGTIKMEIPSQSSIVLWVMNDKNPSLTTAQFNANFSTNLLENSNLFRVSGGGGMANAGPRSLVLRDQGQHELAIASYQNDEQTKADKGIFYRYAATGSKEMELLDDTGTIAATPGTVSMDQVPAVPVKVGELPENQPPVITHNPLAEADSQQDLSITALITAPEGFTVTTAVYYKNTTETESHKLLMTRGSDNLYTASIPKSELTSPVLEYRIEAESNGLQAVTETYSVLVKLPGADDAKAPQLLITELVPDSTNVGNSDGYEFIELYNNTDREMNLKDYKLIYRYTSSGPDADVIWPTDHEAMLIESGETLVFWVINAANTGSTVADFNANYGTQLVEGANIFRIYSAGMANAGDRGLVIATNTRQDISVASYATNEETQPNMGIFYKSPTDGTTEMIKYSAGLLAATPGSVNSVQVPASRVQVSEDTEAPSLINRTTAAEIDQSRDVEIIVDAKDNIDVKTVEIWYKNETQTEYTKRYLAESYNDNMYHHQLFSPELIGHTAVDYYFVVSDGTNEVTSDTYRLRITGGRDTSALRLNVKDGDIVSGEKVLKATAEDGLDEELLLKLDNKTLTDHTYASLENDAYFAFDVSGVNYYFKNGVTIGQEILYTFQDPIGQYTTLTVPITADRLQVGSNTLSIRAGSKTSPFDDRAEENKDDFTIRNIRLVLADGTILYDARYSDPTQEVQMGDSTGKLPFEDFSFVLPEEKFASKTYRLDSTTLTDGEHTLMASHLSEESVSATFKVDNTAPSIVPSLTEGKEYRGVFTIDAVISDAIAGVDAVEAKLDGQSIVLPFATASYLLSSGNHEVEITATDHIGNTGRVSVSFATPNELPAMPELVSPQKGAVGIGSSAGLAVKVSDPLQDTLNVGFYRGFKHDASRLSSIEAYRGAADTEPPKSLQPGGEKSFAAEDYSSISAVDGKYLTDDSVEQFPYQRFEIKLDASVKDSDIVQISWKGNSFAGRKVSLYAWNPLEEAWNLLDHVIAGSEDFELQSSTTAGAYRDGNLIHLMVQDEIAATPDNGDYSFVWMSDTQYYAESYPYIFEDIVDWIAANKDPLNIKYVFHTGDIVDDADQSYQWDIANENMKVLEDAKIPYGVLAGNHDVNHQTGDYSYYWSYFGEDRFKSQPTYGESYKNNMGHYDLISANGNDYIMLYMGWGLEDEDIDWMNKVLQKYPNHKAIISMHEYLLVSGNRASDADKVFERVVIPNKNVIATLSGHYHDAELLVSGVDDTGDGVDDRKVYQMLADYQGAPEGGLGYIRLLKFDTSNNKLIIQTYSPYLNDYNYYDSAEYPGKDEFVLDLDLQPQTKRVSTDYFGVNVYTDQQIGETVSAASGDTVHVDWSGLATETAYEWYTTAADEYGGRTLSDIWSFTTGKAGDPVPTPEVDPVPVEVEPPVASPTPVATPAPTSIATSAPTSTVKPTATPNTDQGTSSSALIVIEPRITDGLWSVSSEQLLKAAAQIAASGIVEVSIGAPVANESIQLQLDSEGLRAVGERLGILKVVMDGTTLTLPAAVLQQFIGTDNITLTASAAKEDTRQAVNQAVSSDSALSSTGIIFTFGISADTKGLQTAITMFKEPITVISNLTSEQRAGIHPIFAGVYYLNGTALDYMGGQVKNGVVSFKTKHFSTFAVLEYQKQFTDMAGHWGKADVQLLAAKHIASGVSEDTFVPNSKITRADFAVLVVKLLGYNDPTDDQLAYDASLSETKFNDVAETKYYAKYVARAEQLGLIQGYKGLFRPQQTLTREEAAVILTKLHQMLASQEAETGVAVAFADMSEAAAWAEASIQTAQELGLVTGRGGNYYMPKSQVTRAEAAAMLARMLE